MFIFTMFNFF